MDNHKRSSLTRNKISDREPGATLDGVNGFGHTVAKRGTKKNQRWRYSKIDLFLAFRWNTRNKKF
jgi:hypothetical protein